MALKFRKRRHQIREGVYLHSIEYADSEQPNVWFDLLEDPKEVVVDLMIEALEKIGFDYDFSIIPSEPRVADLADLKPNIVTDHDRVNE